MLALQTPYLLFVSVPLLKQCWSEQIRRQFFVGGLSASVSVAEVTWEGLKARREARAAAAAQKSKGRPTPKQVKVRPQKAFAEALSKATAPVVPSPAV
jgi:hypothetical protein